MNLSLISKIWSVFKLGGVVADPAKWKAHQISVNQVIALLGGALLLLKGTKYDPHMDDATVAYIGGGLFGIANWLFTVATSDKVGIFGARAPAVAGAAGGAPASGQGTLDPSLGGLTTDAAEAVVLWRKRQPADPAQRVGPQGDGP